MRKLNAKKITGFVAKFLVAAVVLMFLGLHSLNFFTFVFPVDQWYYAWLGFGLTGGGFIAYLLVFLWEADTHLKKWITLAISGVSGLGEILTALFGMQVEAWKKAGFALTEQNFNSMLFAVGLLALAHAAALVGYLAGDKIIEFFGDEDGDGVPNYRDNDYKPNKHSNNQQQNAPKSRQEAPRATPQPQQSQYTLPAFLSASGMNSEHAFGAFLDETETFSMAWKVLRDGLSQDGYRQPPNLTHSNFNDLAGKVRENGNFQKAASGNNHR